LANLNSALRWSNNNTASSSSLTLLSEHSLAYVLCPGTHHIYPDFALEGYTCGLIPLGIPCESITTTGLKWDLNDARLELGGFISSSNTIENGIEKITVTTSHSILWTTQIDWVNYEYESRLADAAAAGSSKL
jgi:thiamine pyrophosphokinase